MKRNLYLQKQNSIHLSLLRFIVFKHEFTEAIKQAHAKYSYLKFFAMYRNKLCINILISREAVEVDVPFT